MNHIANTILAALVVVAGLAAPSSQVTLTGTTAHADRSLGDLTGHRRDDGVACERH